MKRLVIDLGSLPEEGKQYSGELEDSTFELPGEDVRTLGPLAYELHVQRFGNELLLQGRLSAPFEFQCVRTLIRFRQTIEVPTAAIDAHDRPEDLRAGARTVLFLASEESSIVTGASLAADHGYTAGIPLPG